MSTRNPHWPDMAHIGAVCIRIAPLECNRGCPPNVAPPLHGEITALLKTKTPPEGGVLWPWPRACAGLLDLADHPLDGGVHLFIAQRRIAALGRHHARLAGEPFGSVLDQGIQALGNARRPVGLVAHGG